jgi:long-chain fatty acid transport protein
MKNKIKLAVVAVLALGTTSAFATNGAALIGMGAEARGMAGTGIGMAHGAESALTNPALITSVEKTEISFGGTLFMPDVSYQPQGGTEATSDADMSMIPEVSLATKINDNFYVGIGMWGTGGMGVDYRDAAATAGTMQMVTNLQLMQFGVPLAYTTNGFSIAITPILQYGSLDINYATGNPANPDNGMGVAQDLEFGYNIGLAYQMKGFTVGAIYKSKIDMEYKGFGALVSNFTNTALQGQPGTYTNDKLSTPAEIGIGASYAFGEHSIALDYKMIQWSDALGYKDFEWDDQDVISIGYEYKTKGWAARIGYNYASSPISEQSGTYNNSADLNGYTINMFNLLGFPGVVESHYAIGGSYDLNEQTSFDLAFTYAPEVTETYTTASQQTGLYDITTKHSQTGVSAQLNFNF